EDSTAAEVADRLEERRPGHEQRVLPEELAPEDPADQHRHRHLRGQKDHALGDDEEGLEQRAAVHGRPSQRPAATSRRPSAILGSATRTVNRWPARTDRRVTARRYPSGQEVRMISVEVWRPWVRAASPRGRLDRPRWRS